MTIRIYVIDKSKRTPQGVEADLRGALIDSGLPPLEGGKDPRNAYETEPDAVVYRVIIEPVKREKQPPK